MSLEYKIIGGNSNPKFVSDVCDILHESACDRIAKRFADGECQIQIGENVRLKNVFVIQSICPPEVDKNLMEMAFILDALKRTCDGRITAVIPYMGYARQDRKHAPRVAISAKRVAKVIEDSGAKRIITMNLHSDQIQGFFECPVDNLFASIVLIPYVKDNFGNDVVVLAPDAGAVAMAEAFANRIGTKADIAVVFKKRTDTNKTKKIKSIVGNVEGKTVIILDDMIDTAGTLSQAAEEAANNGAKEIIAVCTHAVLSKPAIERIDNSPIKSVIATDTIPLHDEAKDCKKINIISVAPIFAKVIQHANYGLSVSEFFK